MANLIWKWSTNQTNLKASVKSSLLSNKKKKWFLNSLKDTAKSAISTIRKTGADFAKTNKWKRIHKNIQTFKKSPIKSISKGIGLAGNKLTEIWTKAKASTSKRNPIHYASDITRAAWGLISWPEEVRKKVVRIKEKVDSWKITLADGLIQSTLSVGLQGLTVLAAPMIQTVSSALNMTWTDKKLEDWVSFVTNWTVNLLMSKWMSREKAESRTDSAMSAVAGLFMIRWIRTMKGSGKWLISRYWVKVPKGAKTASLKTSIANTLKWKKTSSKIDSRSTKAKVSDFVQGSLEMTIPDFAIMTAAKIFQEEGKDMPETAEFKDAFTLAATSLIWWKWTIKSLKWKAQAEKDWALKLKKPDIYTRIKKFPNKKIDLSKEIWLNEKAIKRVTSHNRWIDKYNRMNILIENEIQDWKRNNKGIHPDLISWKKATKKDYQNQLDIKEDINKELVQARLKKETVHDGRKSFVPTKKGQALWAKKSHTSKVDKKLTNEDNSLETQMKKNKPDFIEEWKVEKEVEIKDPLTQWEIVHLNPIKEKTYRNFTGKAWTFLWDSIKWLLDNVKFTDKEWNVSTLSDKINWITANNRKHWRDILKQLGFYELRKLEDANTDGINKWYKYVKNNYKKIISWNNIEDVMRRDSIRIKDNDLYVKSSSDKWRNTTKNRVIFEFIWWEIQNKVKKIEEAEKRILSDAEIDVIQRKTISQLPKELHSYVNEVFNKYGQIKADTQLKRAFKEIWELEQSDWLIKFLKENYSHWFITNEKIQAYVKAQKKLGKDIESNLFDKNFENIQIQDLKDWEFWTPEQRSAILKNKKNVWYLHSQNPLDIMKSYANELSLLKEQKEILSVIEEAKSKSSSVREFLTHILKWDDNYITKRILGITQVDEIDLNPWLTNKTLSALLYIWNIKMIFQNLQYATVWVGIKIATNFATWKGWWVSTLWKMFSQNTKVRDYFFDQWMLAHKDYNPDMSLRWNSSVGKKLVLNVNDATNKGLRYFSATLIPQLQTAVWMSYMWAVIKKFWWKIKKTWNIVKDFEASLKGMDKADAINIRWELTRQVTTIENNTRLSSATNRIFDQYLFNMVKSFNRANTSEIKNTISDNIDVLHQFLTKKNEKSKKIATGARANVGMDKNRSIENTTTLIWKTYAIYLAAILISKVFDTEEEQNDYVRYTFASDMTAYFKRMAATPALTIGLNILSNMVAELLLNMNSIVAMETPEAKIEALEKLAKGLARWWNFWLRAIKNSLWDYQTHYSRDWWFLYQDTTPTSWLWYPLWINPAASESKGLFKKMNDLRDEIPSESQGFFWNLMKSITSIAREYRFIKEITDLTHRARTQKFRNEALNISNRIVKRENEVMDFKTWIDNALWENKWNQLMLDYKTDLSGKLIANSKSNDTRLRSLALILRNFNTVDRWDFFKWDFNKTLRDLNKRQPKLYHEFMSQVLWYWNNTWNEKVQKSNRVFISAILNKNHNWKLLATSYANYIRRYAEELSKGTVNYQQQRRRTAFDKLDGINQSIKIFKKDWPLKQQIIDSLWENLILTGLSKNRKYIRAAIQKFPEIAKLYNIAVMNRWWVIRTEDTWTIKTEEGSVGKGKPLENNLKKTILEQKNNNKLNNIWKQKTSSLKNTLRKKISWNLVNPVKLTPQKLTPLDLKQVSLNTLLDKVI